MSDKFLLIEQVPLRDSNYSTVKIIAESRDGENRDAMINRWREESKPRPVYLPRPQAPQIEELLLGGDPRERLNPETCDAALAEFGDAYTEYRARLAHMTAEEAYQNVFAPEDLLFLSGSVAGVAVVNPFHECAHRLHNFSDVNINPVVTPRFRVPSARKNIVVSFPGESLKVQLARGWYLGKTLKLQLAVWVPGKCMVEFWYRAGDSVSNRTFALTARELGFTGTYDAFQMAAVASSFEKHDPPSLAASQLQSIGIEPRDYKQRLVLHKAE
jgi:hypothetical protein